MLFSLCDHYIKKPDARWRHAAACTSFRVGDREELRGVCKGVTNHNRPGYSAYDLEILDAIAGFVADFAEEQAGAGGSMTIRESKAVDAYLVA